MRRNRFRELLDSGQPTLGTHVLSVWPTQIELIGQTANFGADVTARGLYRLAGQGARTEKRAGADRRGARGT